MKIPLCTSAKEGTRRIGGGGGGRAAGQNVQNNKRKKSYGYRKLIRLSGGEIVSGVNDGTS